jgi:hypothetical protein
MNKRTLILYMGMAVVISMLTFTLTYSQEDTIQDSGFKDRQRPAAVFDHDEHNEKAGIEECNVCHHVYRDGKKIADESSEGQECSECHRLKAYEGNAIPLMKAYHDLCIGCHKRTKARGGKRGPVTCGECHVRQR